MGSLARLNWTLVSVSAACQLGCASAGTPQKEQTLPSEGAPLASMAGRPVLVLPVQRNVILPESGSWQNQTAEATAFAASLDDSIASSLSRRGLGATWTFAPAIKASARRGGGIVPDPQTLAAGGLTRLVKAGDDPLSEPLASQIRLLVALRDGRYAILPSAVRFDGQPQGDRATLLVYLIDSRTARIAWSGEVASEPSSRFSGAMARSLAQRVADLVVPR